MLETEQFALTRRFHTAYSWAQDLSQHFCWSQCEAADVAAAYQQASLLARHLCRLDPSWLPMLERCQRRAAFFLERSAPGLSPQHTAVLQAPSQQIIPLPVFPRTEALVLPLPHAPATIRQLVERFCEQFQVEAQTSILGSVLLENGQVARIPQFRRVAAFDLELDLLGLGAPFEEDILWVAPLGPGLLRIASLPPCSGSGDQEEPS